MTARRTLYRLDLPPKVACVITIMDNRVIEVPPRWEWLVGWHVKKLAAYIKKRGSLTEIVDGNPTADR